MGKCMSVNVKKKPLDLSSNSSPQIPPTDEYKNLKQISNFPVNPIAKQQISSALSKNHLFKDLTLQDLDRFLVSVKFCVAEDDTTIFEQGSTGTLFFIINSGRVQVIVDNTVRSILMQEDCFGEMALLSDSIRKATIRTMCKCSFWVFSSDAFFSSLKNLYKRSFDQTRKLISGTVFFQNFPDSQLDSISRLAVKEKYCDQDKIVREGDEGDMLYILMAGCVVFKKGIDEFLKISNIGEMFGEGSLLTGEKRQATCVAIGYTEVVSINRKNLKMVFGENYDEIMMKNVAKNSILSDSHLGFLEKNKVIELCSVLKWKRYKEGDVVIQKKYDQLTMFRVVCSGSVTTHETAASTVRSYQVIGLGNLVEKSLKKKNYYSKENTIIGEISLSDIDKQLKMNTRFMFESLDKIKFIYGISFFQGISLESAKLISSKMKTINVSSGTKMFDIGDDSKRLYIVRTGAFEIYSVAGIKIRIVLGNEIFGERCLFDSKRSACVVCAQDGQVYSISIKYLKQVSEYKALVKEAKRKEYYQKKIDLENMTVVSENMLGNGRKIYTIKDTADESKYELVIIQKSSLENQVQCLRLVNERNIMLKLEHKLIVKLVTSLFDEHNIYFITEHIKGRPLLKLFPLSEQFSKILFLHFIKTLEYLHNKNIIHRDFCTENIIVSMKGFPYLKNFQVAKTVKNRTYSRVGSPYHRSPEMIMGRGYTKSTDIWSLGVTLYEMIYGYLPFKMAKGEPPIETYEKILNIKHGIIQSKGEYVNELILGMLSPAHKRLDFSVIQRNLWFSNVNKNKVLSQRESQGENILKKELKPNPGKKYFKASRLMIVNSI